MTKKNAAQRSEAYLARPPMLRRRQDITTIEKLNISDIVDGDDIYHFIETACRKTPEKTAFVSIDDATLETDPIDVSFSVVLEQITRAANLFHSVGASRDNAVSLLLPLTPETHYAIWGAVTASIANPINPFLEIEHIAGVIKAANSKVLVVPGVDIDPDTAKKAEVLKDLAPSLTHIFYIGRPPNKSGLSFLDALEKQNGARLTFDRDPSLENTAAYFHTGGTTGTPKLAKHTHLGQILNSYLVGLINGNDESCTSANGMPIFHVGGAIVLGLRCLIQNQTSVLLTPHGFRTPTVIQNFWKIVETYNVKSTVAVPTVCAGLLSNSELTQSKTPLEFLSTGASTVPEELSLAFEKKFGVQMRELWGMTEIHGVATSNFGLGNSVIGSAGVALPFQNLKVIEHENGRFKKECAVNEVGLIVFSGPTVIKEYVEPEHTKAGFIEGMPDGRRWLNTGDLGRMDKHGYVWIIGRQKDLIIRGGHNIDPAIIEDALLAHDAVAVAAAIGRPDGLKGEMPVAYVQLKPDMTADPNEILRFAADHIPERAATPERVYIIDAMPLTAVGKIFKPALRNDVTIKTVKSIITEINLDGAIAEIDAYVDKTVGLVVETVLSGDPQACKTLKAQLDAILAPYPLRSITRIA